MWVGGVTHSLCFFLGPGLPRALGSPFTAPALRLTPFFLGPSRGGPIGCGAGVPLAAGVAGLESDAFSALDGAGTVVEVAGESLASSLSGVSSFLSEAGSMMARSFRGSTLRVTMRDGVFSGVVLLRMGVVLLTGLPDLRRSFVIVAVLLPGAMT